MTMPCVLYARTVMKLGEDYRGACVSCFLGIAYCNTPVYLARQKFRAMYKVSLSALLPARANLRAISA